EAGGAPELWNDESPEKIIKLYQNFVDAGSDIILTNTFGGTRHRLKLHNAQDRVHELNRKAAELARDVVSKVDKKVIVAGSVGPTGELLAPLGSLTYEQCVEAFVEQMQGLKDGGVDVFWVETMSAPEEINAAAEAAGKVGLEYVVTASFDTAGRTMMGLLPQDMHNVVEQDTRPLAIGANCGVGASDLLSSVLDITNANPNAIVIAKANCGIPQIKGDVVEYTGTPELMHKYTKMAIDAGAKIIGGCCGTTCTHLSHMRTAIDTHQKAQRPAIEDIVEHIGPLVNKPAAANDVESGRGSRRRRRSA
ncbi:MAG: betaine--homocysteine S-methyltransferase, partial [Pseudomonadota bacterium]